MKQYWLAVAAATMVSACSGGNPWLEGDGASDGDGVPTDIPAELTGDLDGFSYNAGSQTLIVRGVSLSNDQGTATYDKANNLNVPGYEGYRSQEGSLKRHSTAYVQSRDGASGVVVVTGGLFGSYFGGSQYSRSGTYDPPTSGPNGGLVTYAGKYVGLLNVAGDGGDLEQVAPGTPNTIRPAQAAEVTGDVVINADFANNQVNGVVYNRVIVDAPGIDLSGQHIDLAPTAIASDGTFIGDTEQAQNDRGTYGGIFAGTDSSAVAGTLFAADHITQINQVEEFGLFVIGSCVAPNPDAVCNQPQP